jgi:RNA polymerase sigma-70 factor (sigma-E family)
LPLVEDVPTQDRVAEFERFVSRHSRELSRFGYLLLGDPDAADDLTADVFLAAWRQWDTVQAVDHPVAYVRRVMANMAASRIRSMTRERRRTLLFRRDALEIASGPDSAVVVDVREALTRMPPGRRACVVLRYAVDLSEREVAETLGISVGTVKSQTAKGVDQLRRLLGDGADRADRPDGVDGWAAGIARGRGAGDLR